MNETSNVNYKFLLFILKFQLALILTAYNSIKHINSYKIDKIEKFCSIFFTECFSDNYKSLLSQLEKEIAEVFSAKVQSFHTAEAKKILQAFLSIYEFIDRGMKGLLSGDISLNLLQKSQPLFDKYLKELKEIEDEFLKHGLNPNDFYDSFFKIDDSFYNNNTSKNLTMNLSKQLEHEGHHTQRLLYYVNIKHTQFLDSVKQKLYVKSDKIDIEEIKKILENKKKETQHIINDLYNEISDAAIVNMLKTPIYGIINQERENKNNLFRRQLMIEEGSFDNANNHFVKIFSSLQE